MRNLKKFLALVLAMMMALSLMVTVNAANKLPDVDNVENVFQEAVQVLNGMDVIKGVADADGKFMPKKTLTRAEAAAIIYRLHSGDVKDESIKVWTNYATVFEDVGADKWYAGYVGYCYGQGIIAGVDATHFSPSREVKGYEFLAMILRAIGYNHVDANGNQEFTGTGWQTRVAQYTNINGLLADVNDSSYAGKSLNVPATREMVASVSFLAAQTKVYIYHDLFGYRQSDSAMGGTATKSLGETNFGLADMTGIVVGNQATGEAATMLGVTFDYDQSEDEVTYTGESYVYASDDETNFNADQTGKNATLSFKIDTGLNQFGHKVKVWYKSTSNDTANPLTVGDTDTNTINLPDNYGTVYASVDKSTHSAVVCSKALADDKDDLSDVTSAGNGYLGGLIKDAGFSYGVGSKVWKNAKFEAMAAGDEMTVAASTSKVDSSTNNVYLAISNSPADKDGKYPLNMVVAMEMSVETITAKNDYTNPKTVSLNITSGKAIERSTADVAANDILLSYGEKNIAVGAEVVVNAMTGTKTQQKDKSGNDQNVTYIGIDKITEKKTGKVTSISSTGKVTLDTGDTIERSALWSLADAQTNYKDTAVNNKGKDLLLIGASLNFWLDGYGKYLGVSKDTNVPFMGAYGYWEQTGTSTIKYYIQGVTRKGVEVKEEIDLTTYQALFTTPAKATPPTNEMPFLSTTLVSGATTTSLSITPVGTSATGFGYDNLIVANKQTTTGSAGWSPFPGAPKQTFTKGQDRFTDGTQARYLTDSTVFHVVTGYGDNLKIEHFTGLSDLLQGNDSIEFNGYYFIQENDSEHTAGKNGVVEEALLVNVKRISTSSFFFNKTAVGNPSSPALQRTADGKAVQYTMYAAGQREDGSLLISRITDKSGSAQATMSNSTTINASAETVAKVFYLAGLDADGYYELAEQDNSTPTAKTYAYYSNGSNGELKNDNTAFGEIKFLDAKSATVTLNAADATVIDVSTTAETNGISDYETLRRAAEENKIEVSVLVTSAGGTTASVIYVTSVAVRP